MIRSPFRSTPSHLGRHPRAFRRDAGRRLPDIATVGPLAVHEHRAQPRAVGQASPTPFELLWAARPLPDAVCTADAVLSSALGRLGIVPMISRRRGRIGECQTACSQTGFSSRQTPYRQCAGWWRGLPGGSRDAGLTRFSRGRVTDIRRPQHRTTGVVPRRTESKASQAVRDVEIGSRRVVLYRDLEGRAHAVDDRCPHLGSDLALAHVTRDGLLCEFHGWCWGTDGACVAAPGNPGLPGRHLRHYPTAERWGFVWAWLGGQPAFPLPDIPPHLSKRVVLAPRRVRAHPDVIFSNGFDLAHFGPSHGIDATTATDRRRVDDRSSDRRQAVEPGEPPRRRARRASLISRSRSTAAASCTYSRRRWSS